MARILLQVPVDASREDVYRALTKKAGVTAWWSSRTTGPSGEGSVMKVSFPDAPITFDFRVEEVFPPERVGWRCLAGPPEWIGTGITFDISAQDGTTNVLFTHDGWKTTKKSFPFIAYSWAQILPRLKAFAESGRRQPFFDF
ncbi:MAG TPA: SRPBCC domain-containing protein [Actinomycetota bacterium]|jgi:uncharacterized protein YndB with AHSA1/START domain|nr:SRPBCC domain-containing protein [Actinomycetota bacterium]